MNFSFSQLVTSATFFNNSQSKCASGVIECRHGLVLPAWPPPSYYSINGTAPSYAALTVGDRILRGSVYLILLIYMFWGISVSSDCFMDAIDHICKTRKRFSAIAIFNFIILIYLFISSFILLFYLL